MDNGILIIGLLVFVVALLVLLLKSGSGKAVLKLLGLEISTESKEATPTPLNVIEAEDGSKVKGNWQGAKTTPGKPGQNIIKAKGKSTVDDNVQEQTE